MDVKKWKNAFRDALKKDKMVKLILILGICGIALIYLSTLLEPGKEKKDAGSMAEGSAANGNDYGEKLEADLARIVQAITGEEAPAVMVTLESGSRYVYAADEKKNTQENGAAESPQSSAGSEKAHVILKDSDGTQHALTVTEIEPKVKGVVIVSRYAGDPVIREKLTNAVKTALDVSSAKVCVTDTG